MEHPGQPLVSMNCITKKFSGNLVLDNVSFDLRRGEVHVLAGENGAGKSTLIKILGGVHGDYSGGIFIEGEPVRFDSPRRARDRGISIIHQETSLVPSMNVIDNIFLGNEIRKRGLLIDYGAEEIKALETFKRLGLDIDLHGETESCPAPVRQLIEIAKALSFNSSIIVMDEPTSSLNEDEAKRLFDVIRDLKDRRCGIVYITHKMEEIFALADRITVLRDGRRIDTAPASEIDLKTLVRWMVGRDMGEHIPARAARPGRERLVVKNVSLRGPTGSAVPLLDHVTFSARAGEILGFAGLQGSGNSALFNALFGAYGGRMSGEVLLDGNRMESPSPGKSIRRGLALLTNDRNANGYVPDMSVIQNMTLASLPRFSPRLLTRPGDEAAATEAQSEALNLKIISADMPAGTLSGGSIQKVIIGKWLLADPGVYLMDDPTRGIDVLAKHDIYRLIYRLADGGNAVLLISSEMHELLSLSDRIIVMHRGRVATEYTREEACRENVLCAAMGIV